jgi:hypothetical protein
MHFTERDSATSRTPSCSRRTPPVCRHSLQDGPAATSGALHSTHSAPAALELGRQRGRTSPSHDAPHRLSAPPPLGPCALLRHWARGFWQGARCSPSASCNDAGVCELRPEHAARDATDIECRSMSRYRVTVSFNRHCDRRHVLAPLRRPAPAQLQTDRTPRRNTPAEHAPGSPAPHAAWLARDIAAPPTAKPAREPDGRTSPL